MASDNTLLLLNQLHVLHSRSLPVYLRYAEPWMADNQDQILQSLQLIASDQTQTADDFARLIRENGWAVDPGEFPMPYTGYHDLSFDYVLGIMIKEQQQMISQLEQIISELGTAPLYQAKAEEALGAAKAHLEVMQSLNESDSTSNKVAS